MVSVMLIIFSLWAVLGLLLFSYIHSGFLNKQSIFEDEDYEDDLETYYTSLYFGFLVYAMLWEKFYVFCGCVALISISETFRDLWYEMPESETTTFYGYLFSAIKAFFLSLYEELQRLIKLPSYISQLINNFGWSALISPNVNISFVYPNIFKPQYWLKTHISFWRIPLYFTYNVKVYKPKITWVPQILIFYNFFKTTLVSLFLTIIYFIYMLFFFKIQFLKQLSIWFIIGMMIFWLFSGFNFFLKRYQYGKFTAQIQRFWKRTNTCFWLIEGFLILLFFYYFLNSSQEPVYMYDYSSLNQEYLVSLQTISFNVIVLSMVIYFMYFILLRVNSTSWQQLNAHLLLVSLFIFFSFFIETYQFMYVISTFNERLWLFNEEENLWSVEVDNPILRTKHQYLLVCLIAKYWHFLFIFLSWVFFLMKSLERKKITYALLSVNIQNFIILYALNFVCYIQWFKWIYRRFFDMPYTWFLTNNDTKITFRFCSELYLYTINYFNWNSTSITWYNLVWKSLTLWESNSLVLWKFV